MNARGRLRPRLLPVVLSGLTGLAILKILGLTTQGAYVFPPGFGDHSGFARALTGYRPSPPSDEDTTGATPAKKDTPKPPEPQLGGQKTAEAGKAPEPATQPLPPTANPAERQVLENLAERRRQLDRRAEDLEIREQLIKSAEQRLEERLGDLKEQEARGESAAARDARAFSPYKSLVTIYEAMKPREAAKVFERMEARQLASLAHQMNPRKLSEILAQMSPDSAEKLTAALMRRQTSGDAAKDPPSAPPQGQARNSLPELEELPKTERPQPQRLQ